MWNRNEPNIVPLDFELNQTNLCSNLWDKLKRNDFTKRMDVWENGSKNIASSSYISSIESPGEPKRKYLFERVDSIPRKNYKTTGLDKERVKNHLFDQEGNKSEVIDQEKAKFDVIELEEDKFDIIDPEGSKDKIIDLECGKDGMVDDDDGGDKKHESTILLPQFNEPTYVFCPVAGIICTLCQTRVWMNSFCRSFATVLGVHESTKGHHHRKMNDIETRRKISDAFDKAMDRIANMIMASPTLHDARNIVIQHLDEGTFMHCTECKSTVLDVNHHLMNHAAYCTPLCNGYKPKLWNKCHPIILPSDFELNVNSLCGAIWFKLQKLDYWSRSEFWKYSDDGNIEISGPPLLSIGADQKRSNIFERRDENNQENYKSIYSEEVDGIDCDDASESGDSLPLPSAIESSSIATVPIEDLYRVCPVAGIICMLCETRVGTYAYQTFAASIGDHERRCHPHGITDLDVRKTISNAFGSEIDRITNMMIASPTLRDARNVVIDELDEGSFMYCSKCNSAVNDVNHYSMRHAIYCTPPRNGYKPKMWNKKFPNILPYDFELNESNLCHRVWLQLQAKDFGSRLTLWNNPSDGYAERSNGILKNRLNGVENQRRDVESTLRDRNSIILNRHEQTIQDTGLKLNQVLQPIQEDRMTATADDNRSTAAINSNVSNAECKKLRDLEQILLEYKLKVREISQERDQAKHQLQTSQLKARRIALERDQAIQERDQEIQKRDKADMLMKDMELELIRVNQELDSSMEISICKGKWMQMLHAIPR